MKVSNNVKYNIYERQPNVKQLSIDSLPIRVHAPKYTQYYNAPQRKTKRCKICVDSWDNGKILKTMASNHKAIKETSIYYYIDVENGNVDKLKVYLHHHKDTQLDYNNVFYGTKTQALKRLAKLMA